MVINAAHHFSRLHVLKSCTFASHLQNTLILQTKRIKSGGFQQIVHNHLRLFIVIPRFFCLDFPAWTEYIIERKLPKLSTTTFV